MTFKTKDVFISADKIVAVSGAMKDGKVTICLEHEQVALPTMPVDPGDKEYREALNVARTENSRRAAAATVWIDAVLNPKVGDYHYSGLIIPGEFFEAVAEAE